MKQILFLVASAYLLISTNRFSTHSVNVDPIQFSMSTNANRIALNEEFELNIKVNYIAFPANTAFVFKESNSFKIKVVFPEGFVQTGGTYSDFVGGTLSSSQESITYTIRGKFTSASKDNKFQLLRGSSNATTQSQLVFVNSLSYSILEPTKATRESSPTLILNSSGVVQYMTLAQLRDGDAGLSEVVFLNEHEKSGIFVLDLLDKTTVDDSALVVVASDTLRYKRSYSGSINVKWFGAKGDTLSDDAAPIQRAINAIASKTGNLNPVKFNNSLEITAGTYKLGSTIMLPINVRLKILGHVNFMFTNSGIGIHIYSNDEVIPVYYKEMYTRGSIIDGSAGNFNVLHRDYFRGYGLNYQTSIPRSNIKPGTIGIQIGNDPDNNRLMPRYTLSDIAIAGFETGLDLVCNDNYMATFERLHIEGNKNAIRTNTPTGVSPNSGENMTFYKCLIAGADNAVLCQGANIDMTFDMCSIDFVINAFKLDVQFKGFNHFKLNNCYFERVTNKLVDSYANGSPYRSPTFYFQNCTMLNGRAEMFRNAVSGKGYSLKFEGCSYRIDDGTNETDEREAWNSLDPDHFMLVEPNSSINVVNKDLTAGLQIPPIIENNVNSINPQFDYKIATVGTSASTYYNPITAENIASQSIVSDSRGNALKIVSSTGLLGLIQCDAKARTAVQFNDVYTMSFIYKAIPASGAATTLVPKFGVKEYDANDQLIATTASTQKVDTFTPNTWRCARWGQQIRISNRNTKTVRFFFTVGQLKGEIYIDTIIIDKRP